MKEVKLKDSFVEFLKDNTAVRAVQSRVDALQPGELVIQLFAEDIKGLDLKVNSDLQYYITPYAKVLAAGRLHKPWRGLFGNKIKPGNIVALSSLIVAQVPNPDYFEHHVNKDRSEYIDPGKQPDPMMKEIHNWFMRGYYFPLNEYAYVDDQFIVEGPVAIEQRLDFKNYTFKISQQDISYLPKKVFDITVR